jgi:TRAP-type C4-dicarboxylate transport system permease small subunit
MMKVVDRLLTIIEVPIRFMLWLALVAGFLMMMHVTVDVTGRTLFNRPFSGTTEIVSAYYMVAAALLPWAWLARNNDHIMVELFTQTAPKRFNEWLDILVKIVTIAYVSLFSWQTCLRAIEQTRAGEVWEAAGRFIPVWPSRWILPIAGGLMVLYLILRVVSDAVRAARRV